MPARGAGRRRRRVPVAVRWRRTRPPGNSAAASLGMMGLGFGGEVAESYARYRRGYPSVVLDAVVAAFGLTSPDVVVDLGCGTGQLTLPLARRVGVVVGVDPEPDMLRVGRRAAAASCRTSAGCSARTPTSPRWPRCSVRSVAAVTIGTALHWMRPAELFATLDFARMGLVCDPAAAGWPTR